MNTSHARSWQQTHATERTSNEKRIVKVRKTGWVTKGEKVLYTIVGACLIIGCVLMVSYSSSTDTMNREIESLENKVQKQEVKNEGLLFEMKELSNPDRITRIARENGFQTQDAEVKQAQAFNN